MVSQEPGSRVTTIPVLCQNKVALIDGVQPGGQSRDWNSAFRFRFPACYLQAEGSAPACGKRVEFGVP